MRLPGDDPKITNEDEQAVAVNSSTTEDGYDEPVNRTETSAEKTAAEAKSSNVENQKNKPSPPPHHTKAN